MAAVLASLVLAVGLCVGGGTQAFAAVAPGTTVLLPDVGSPSCGAVAIAASSDARYILMVGCTGGLVRLDRNTGVQLDVTTGSGGTHYAYTGGGVISGNGDVVSYLTAIAGRTQVIVHNLSSGRFWIASSASDGSPGNASSNTAVLSSNGRWVLFSSDASNLVAGVKPGGGGQDPNIFRKNLVTGAVGRAVKTNGPPDGWMSPGGISDTGEVIAFDSSADNMTGNTAPTSSRGDAYLRDLATGAVQQLLYQPTGTQSQGSDNASVSADGATAAFLGMDSSGFAADVLECSLSAGLAQAPSCVLVASAFPVFDLHLAANGSAVEYSAANTPESGSIWQVFRVGLAGTDAGVASVNNARMVANTVTGNSAGIQGISGDGATVFFSSAATNLDPAATDGQTHAFLRTQASMKHFVVLGDSYSSGEGNPPFLPPSDIDHCDRSYAAYAEDLTSIVPDMALTGFAACSGAKSGQIISGMKGESSQLQSVSKSDDFVILTVGGDDIDFKKFVTACLQPHPFPGCAKGTTAYQNAENLIRNVLPSSLATLFNKVAATVNPGARVLVLGYPGILPPLGAPYLCSGLTAASQTGAQKVEGDLNAAIAAAVKAAGASFEYVDPYGQFQGHELCSPNSYFRGHSGRTSYWYHPNAAGQRAYARAVKVYLGKHPTAP